MTLTGKRVAVLVEQQYQEMEVWYPVYRLREAGCDGGAGRPGGRQDATRASSATPPSPTSRRKDATADQFDAVVIPGGFAPDYIRR